MMKTFKIAMLLLGAAGLIVFSACTRSDVVKSGGESGERGKALFNDVNFAGGTLGNSCNTCHPDGRHLENAASKKEFRIMGIKLNSLEDAINFCIETHRKGKAIDPKGEDMAEIIAYIKTLE